MSGSRITIKGEGGDFSAYLASPGPARGPGIVILQEIFGITKGLRDVADGMASRGFFVVVPDLFWRLERDVELSDKVEADRQKAFSLLGRFDQELGLKDIQATINHLRGMGSAKVGMLGYCMGGLLAYLSAARTDCDCAVSYYGVRIHEHLDEADRIRRPLMMHIAEADEFVPPPAQEKIIAALSDNPHVTIHRYPLMGHAFTRVGGMHYDKAMADLANIRSATFFRKNLS